MDDPGVKPNQGYLTFWMSSVWNSAKQKNSKQKKCYGILQMYNNEARPRRVTHSKPFLFYNNKPLPFPFNNNEPLPRPVNKNKQRPRRVTNSGPFPFYKTKPLPVPFYNKEPRFVNKNKPRPVNKNKPHPVHFSSVSKMKNKALLDTLWARLLLVNAQRGQRNNRRQNGSGQPRNDEEEALRELPELMQDVVLFQGLLALGHELAPVQRKRFQQLFLKLGREYLSTYAP